MAADLDMSTGAPGFSLLAVTTSAAKKVLMPAADLTVLHTGTQDDGSTASDAADYVVVMLQADSMAANMSAGTKVIVKQGKAVTIRGAVVTQGDDGDREIHVQANGNGAMIQFIAGAGLRVA